MVTITVPEQCPAAGHVGSPPPLAVAVLVPLVADAPTLTFNVNAVLAVAASVPVNVQLSAVVPVHDQLAPAKVVKVIPTGSVSLIVMLPTVVAVPVLVTVTV